MLDYKPCLIHALIPGQREVIQDLCSQDLDTMKPRPRLIGPTRRVTRARR